MATPHLANSTSPVASLAGVATGSPRGRNTKQARLAAYIAAHHTFTVAEIAQFAHSDPIVNPGGEADYETIRKRVSVALATNLKTLIEKRKGERGVYHRAATNAAAKSRAAPFVPLAEILTEETVPVSPVAVLPSTVSIPEPQIKSMRDVRLDLLMRVINESGKRIFDTNLVISRARKDGAYNPNGLSTTSLSTRVVDDLSLLVQRGKLFKGPYNNSWALDKPTIIRRQEHVVSRPSSSQPRSSLEPSRPQHVSRSASAPRPTESPPQPPSPKPDFDDPVQVAARQQAIVDYVMQQKHATTGEITGFTRRNQAFSGVICDSATFQSLVVDVLKQLKAAGRIKSVLIRGREYWEVVPVKNESPAPPVVPEYDTPATMEIETDDDWQLAIIDLVNERPGLLTLGDVVRHMATVRRTRQFVVPTGETKERLTARLGNLMLRMIKEGLLAHNDQHKLIEAPATSP